MGVGRRLKHVLSRLLPPSRAQSSLLDHKLERVLQGLDNQSQLMSARFDELIEGSKNQSQLLNTKLSEMIELLRQQNKLIESRRSEPTPQQSGSAPNDLNANVHPLMFAEKTYNTSHPDYDATLVRNFPGTIFNADKPCSNPVYAALKHFATGDQVASSVWDTVLKAELGEARTVPHVEQVFERRTFIENYVAQLTKTYRARYAPGWVNMDDALFLYWLVRRLKPKTVVQTGVSNGLSSSFIMLALAKNGPDGRLHVIDLPHVFDPKDSAWTVAGERYGVVIPEGKTTGWMVPDAYRDRFEVWNGDAKDLLPKLIDKLPSIDMFYHDSDHTYDHMMFEFREAKRKLRPGGLMVGDDISWNSSLWDFADQHGVPSYNFKGAVGVAFF